MTKKYEELQEAYKNWPDRLKTLEEAYAKKTKAESTVKSEL